MNDRSIPELYNPSDESLTVTEAELSAICSEIESTENVRFHLLEVVYIGSDEMIRLNRDHKKHNYLTDILTFPYHDEGASDLEATLYCSPSRIREQASEWDVPEREEFIRVFIHGLLHLCGYDDQSESDRERMKEREEFYLSKWRELSNNREMT
ncbi:MAG: rRNA maturation RNase YbeY [Bacteroidota bacterium]